MPYESTLFAGDDLESTIHVVSYRVDSSLNEPIGCLSLLIPETANGTINGNLDATALVPSNRVPLQRVQLQRVQLQRVQLRGMAVLQSYQGLGSQRSVINRTGRRPSLDILATSQCNANNNDANNSREHEYNECKSLIGVGGELLNYVHRMAEHQGWELWCNARETAVSFYAKYGWRVDGKPFEIPRIGPHYVMRWNCWMRSEDTQ